jgi:hypothetical protein
MQELLVRGKNTIDPEVIDPGGQSVEDSPVKIDFTLPYTRCDNLIPVKAKFAYLRTSGCCRLRILSL